MHIATNVHCAVDTLLLDLRHGARLLHRQPGFTLVAVLALGLGIGVNTTVFTLGKALLFRPLDAQRPDEMMNLALVRPRGAAQYTFSYPDYEAYRDSLRSFRGVIGFATDHLPVSDGSGPPPPGASRVETVFTYVVSENYFTVLGMKAVRGRTFDEVPTAELVRSPAVLISENYWQRRYAGDPAVLGRTIHLNGAAVMIMGITPHNFVGTGMSAPDIWLPLSLAPFVHADDSWLRDRENQRIRLFARLAPGANAGQAQAEMSIVADRLRALHDPRGPSATPATAMIWRGSPSPLPLTSYRGLVFAIVFVMAAAAVVLVVACANVGSLQLARAQSRADELHTRAALGATRWRVIRQLLTESALLGLLAGAAALSFTWALLRVAVIFIAGVLPSGNGTLILDVTPDLSIFAYVSVISLIAGVVFGLAPAVESSRVAIAVASRTGTASTRSRRIQDVLIAAQVGLSLVLLIVGSMMIRGAINAIRTDPGYDNTHLVMLEVRFPEAARYAVDRKDALVRELHARLRALPGVASVTDALPPSVAPSRTAAVALDPNASAHARLQSIIHYGYVQANYFETVGIPFVFGRTFASEAGPEHAVVLSESTARELWPEQNPVGRNVRLGVIGQGLQSANEVLQSPTELVANGDTYEVVGVVRDILGVEFDGSGSRQVYLTMRSDRFAGYPILVRTRLEPSSVLRAIDPILPSIDTNLLATTSSLGELYRQSAPFLVSTLSAAVASIVGVFGLLLAAIGIYGTVSYVVVRRTREIGIRMALGAGTREVLALVIRDSTRPVVVGVVLGLMLATGVSYLLRGLLYGLNTVDGPSFIGVSLLLLTVALLATYAPARRAARVDPNVALRYE